MAGDKGRAAAKLRGETEMVHVAGSVCFGVFVDQFESEQIPRQNENSGANGESFTPFQNEAQPHVLMGSQGSATSFSCSRPLVPSPLDRSNGEKEFTCRDHWAMRSRRFSRASVVRYEASVRSPAT